jgi:hypothetical protein
LDTEVQLAADTNPWLSILYMPLALVGYNGYLYMLNGGTIVKVNISNTAEISNFIILPSSGYGLSVQDNWLYVSLNDKIIRYNLQNPLTKYDLLFGLPVTLSYNSTNYTSLANCRSIVTNGDKLYVINAVNGTTGMITAIDLPKLYIPFPTVSINAENTKMVSFGNVQVQLFDPSNTLINEVYYEYSINGNAYINSNVFAGTSPYTFFIPSIRDISNTIYVRASNTVGNSSPSANLQVIVYQTPRPPSQVAFELVQSGNVRVTIQETAPIPDYYYLNNVSYFLYAYNTAGVTNLSGNTAASIYNVPMGILSNTNSSYENIVSYVNTGLSANTYTMYVIAKNTVGNSNPISANIDVYTTPDFPPKIDTTNTKSATSGNLTVSFTDPSNNPNNAISYWYYVYDPSTGANNAGNVLMYSNTGATLTTGAQQSVSLSGFVNKTYTVYLLSKNTVGNSVPTNANVKVYTVPTVVSIDTANTYSVSSGNLQVVLIDPSNGTNNGVYYQYSIDGSNGNAFSNASAQSIGTSSNQYRFYISGFSNATYTINVVAKNTVGTSNATTFTKTVYTTPTAPVIDPGNTLSKTSGNLTVTFNDTTNTPLNDISYGYFLYDSSIELYYG